jgi:GABA permease
MLFIYLLIAAAQWRLRNRFEAVEPARLHLKMWLHPYGTLLAMLAMLGVLGAMAVTPALAPQFYASLAPLVLAAIAQMLRARSKNSRSNIPD